MKSLNQEKVSVVGLGKLGLAFCAALAHKGFSVLGVDINQNTVDSINKGVSPLIEPGLDELVKLYGGKKFEATKEHKRAIDETDITFILVASPTDEEGNFSNDYVESALKSLSETLKNSSKEYHLFVISSTLMPTATQERLIPLIEKYSGRKLNEGFGVCYTPVQGHVALGSVVKDFINLYVVVIGESDKFAGEQLESLFQRFCQGNNAYIGRMSIISAEIAKVAVNNYLTMKMSFGNMMANLCEITPGAEVDLITQAVGADKRINPLYLKAGLSFGGTCFPRDTKAFISFAKKKGYEADLVKAVEKINAFQDKRLTDLVLEKLSKTGKNKVSILGLAFKPDTPVVVESAGMKLVQNLLKKGIEVSAYDPMAKENAKQVFQDKIKYASSVEECLAFSTFWVITIPDKEFKVIDGKLVKDSSTVIVDCWRILNPDSFSGKANYIKWGYSN